MPFAQFIQHPRRCLHTQWQHGGWLSNLLLPLAGFTQAIVHAKRACYRLGWLPTYHAPVPVIVIGNIYLGGTGKTPLVIALVQALQARGWTPGVISRGYPLNIRGQPHTGQREHSPLTAQQFGDEPVVIAQETGAPLSVHPNRARAIQALLSIYPEVDIIVADDGLQHLALHRDIEIVVQDPRGVGNGRLLPAGPLRESASRLTQVDALVTHLVDPAPLSTPVATKPRCLTMWLEPQEVWHLCDRTRHPLRAFQTEYANARIAAVAGIGHPERFFATLRAAGIALQTTLALADHYPYTHSPFTNISADLILITLKDAVKCQHLKDHRLWAVSATPRFSDPGFFDWIVDRLPRPPKLH